MNPTGWSRIPNPRLFWGESGFESLDLGSYVVRLSVMVHADGHGAMVADAVEEIRARAQFVTEAPGGRGAVREVADRLRRAWEEASASAADRQPGSPSQ